MYWLFTTIGVWQINRGSTGLGDGRLGDRGEIHETRKSESRGSPSGGTPVALLLVLSSWLWKSVVEVRTLPWCLQVIKGPWPWCPGPVLPECPHGGAPRHRDACGFFFSSSAWVLLCSAWDVCGSSVNSGDLKCQCDAVDGCQRSYRSSPYATQPLVNGPKSWWLDRG